MIRLGTLASAFAFGAAVGFLENAISGWALRLAARWPLFLALQYVLRIGLSLVSLYVTYRVSAGDAAAVVANLAGLLVARYLLLWRLTQGDRGRQSR